MLSHLMQHCLRGTCTIQSIVCRHRRNNQTKNYIMVSNGCHYSVLLFQKSIFIFKGVGNLVEFY